MPRFAELTVPQVAQAAAALEHWFVGQEINPDDALEVMCYLAAHVLMRSTAHLSMLNQAMAVEDLSRGYGEALHEYAKEMRES